MLGDLIIAVPVLIILAPSIGIPIFVVLAVVLFIKAIIVSCRRSIEEARKRERQQLLYEQLTGIARERARARY